MTTPHNMTTRELGVYYTVGPATIIEVLSPFGLSVCAVVPVLRIYLKYPTNHVTAEKDAMVNNSAVHHNET